MGFPTVYKALVEVFPEVDSRMLRAVAIEHSKDADAAVEVVLTEVIPYLKKQSPSGSSNDSGGLLNWPTDFLTSEAAADADSIPQTDNALLANSAFVDELVNSSLADACGENNSVLEDIGKCVISNGEESNLKEASPDISSSTLVHDSEVITSPGKCEAQGSSAKEDGPEMSSPSITLVHEKAVNDEHESEQVISLGKCQESSAKAAGSDRSPRATLEVPKYGHLHAGWEDYTLGLSPIQKCMQNSPDSSLQLVEMPVMLINELGKIDSSGSINVASKKDIFANELVEAYVASKKDIFANELVEADSAIATRSGEVCKIHLLEEIIEDARSNKKILFSAMDSVIRLMREVERQEEAAEQAKEEVARGGLDTLSKVEDLKQHLRRAKEANDMHAGEVYGEKAILVTEVRELQSRLLNLSDERDKSLAVLDEMRRTLEVRLSAAEKEMKAAEQEKLEKTQSAHKVFLDQQLINEKVREESEMLRQEAEENSKLREFLVDRGGVVDTLQGEISVICQDVKVMKDKFDKRVPLCKSLSSSQTSCALASSTSSLKSVSPDQVPKLADSSETPEKTSATPSICDELPFEEGLTDDRKALADEGWEFFDNVEVYL